MLDLPRWLDLNRREFERQFGLPAVELKEIVALDAIELLPEQSSLPPTTLDSECVAGLQWHGRTVLAEAADFIDAYHRLWRKAVREEIFQRDHAWPHI